MRKGPRLVTKVGTFVYSLTAALMGCRFCIHVFILRDIRIDYSESGS